MLQASRGEEVIQIKKFPVFFKKPGEKTLNTFFQNVFEIKFKKITNFLKLNRIFFLSTLLFVITTEYLS